MTVPGVDFRSIMAHFATGVTVVTALSDGRPQGITVNAVASVSLDPPLVVIALDRSRFIVPTIEATGRYAVNVLAEEQQGLSDCFAGANVTPDRDAFCGAAWRAGTTGLPILEGAIAALECEVVERVRVGDHELYIARAEACVELDAGAPPLLYHRRRYLRIERASTARLAGKPESPAG
jgi:flavin reductase (DIM6/NTAB) family NADH-FMN oxidoreductase RutF